MLIFRGSSQTPQASNVNERKGKLEVCPMILLILRGNHPKIRETKGTTGSLGKSTGGLRMTQGNRKAQGMGRGSFRFSFPAENQPVLGVVRFQKYPEIQTPFRSQGLPEKCFCFGGLTKNGLPPRPRESQRSSKNGHRWLE